MIKSTYKRNLPINEKVYSNLAAKIKSNELSPKKILITGKEK